MCCEGPRDALRVVAKARRCSIRVCAVHKSASNHFPTENMGYVKIKAKIGSVKFDEPNLVELIRSLDMPSLRVGSE